MYSESSITTRQSLVKFHLKKCREINSTFSSIQELQTLQFGKETVLRQFNSAEFPRFVWTKKDSQKKGEKKKKKEKSICSFSSSVSIAGTRSIVVWRATTFLQLNSSARSIRQMCRTNRVANRRPAATTRLGSINFGLTLSKDSLLPQLVPSPVFFWNDRSARGQLFLERRRPGRWSTDSS